MTTETVIDPWEAARELRARQDEAHAKADRQGRWRGYPQEVWDLGAALARQFGQERGWNWTDRDFGTRVLARRGVHYGRRNAWEEADLFPDSVVDHPYFYRRNRKAAGVAAHLYDVDYHWSAILQFAQAYGLRVTRPNFPSWWFPGWTTLVLYEPADRGSVDG